MGVAKMSFNFSGGGSMSVKLLAQALAALPEDTRLLGIERGLCSSYSLLLGNKVFKDDSEITPTFERYIAVLSDSELVEVDQFVGLDLKDCLINVNEEAE